MNIVIQLEFSVIMHISKYNYVLYTYQGTLIFLINFFLVEHSFKCKEKKR